MKGKSIASKYQDLGENFMFSHLNIGVSNFNRAFAFYAPLMTELGLELKFKDEVKLGWAGWKPPNVERPLFIISMPYNREHMSAGNGQMTAFLAASRDIVDKAYIMAISLGATCEGKPRLRPHYHEDYYGAYFRDIDGNKLCICCHVKV